MATGEANSTTEEKKMLLRSKIMVVIIIVLYAILMGGKQGKAIRQGRARLLTMVFILSFFPSRIEAHGLVFNSNILIALIAGIESVDALFESDMIRRPRRKS